MKAKMKWILGLSVAVLAACGNGETSDQGNGETGNNDGKIQLRFSSWDEVEDLDNQQAMVDRFNESQDEIEVTLEGLGEEYDRVLATGMGAGDAPDIMYMWNYPQYYEGLEPLDSYIEAEGADFKENVYPALWNNNQYDGTIYGMPIGYTSHALYFNKDLFDEVGIDYPTSDWTMSQLRDAANEIAGLGDDTYGFVFPGKPDVYTFESYLWSNGTAYLNDEGTLDGYVNSPESIEAFTFFQDMVKEESAYPSEGYGTEEMASGKAGMYIYGAWGIDRMLEADINLGIVEIPSFDGKGQSASVTNSSGLSISADSEHKDAAWEFIKYWTSEEANIERIDYELPVLQSVVESENLEEDELRQPFYSMLERSGDFTHSSLKVETWSRTEEELEYVYEQIFNPSVLADPEEILNSIVE